MHVFHHNGGACMPIDESPPLYILDNQQLLEFGHLQPIQDTNQDNRDGNCPAVPRSP